MLPLLFSRSTHNRYTGLYALLALSAYFLGLIWRTDFVFFRHSFQHFVYSDMQGYLQAMRFFVHPSYHENIADTVHPPGMQYLFGWTLRSINWVFLINCLQLIFSSAMPLLLFGIAKTLFDLRTALLALALSSLYFPFIYYSGFLLTENAFTFFLMAAVFALLQGISLAKRNKVFWAGAIGAVAGLLFGISSLLKGVALYYLGGLLLFIAWRTLRNKNALSPGEFKAQLASMICAATTGLILFPIPFAIRCTQLSGGKFCVLANEASRNVLLGHYGSVRSILWRDPLLKIGHLFGSPVAYLRGYTQDFTFDFGVYDNARNWVLAWDWTRSHPFHALWLSISNVFDLFIHATPFPIPVGYENGLIVASFWLFMLLALLPFLYRLMRSPIGTLHFLAVPLAILGAIAFVALGEPRYRIPLDGLILIGAAGVWCNRHTVNDDTFSRFI